jgi:hypothetical protein
MLCSRSQNAKDDASGMVYIFFVFSFLFLLWSSFFIRLLFIYLFILMQIACVRTYVWSRREKSWVQRSDDGARLVEVPPRACTGSWTLETSCTGVSTRRILRWSRHSWHTVNMTDTTSQIWNMKQFVLDTTIALYWRESRFSFNLIKALARRHFRLRTWDEFLKWESPNYSILSPIWHSLQCCNLTHASSCQSRAKMLNDDLSVFWNCLGKCPNFNQFQQ